MTVLRELILHRLVWVCALLPFNTTHASYLIAASHGHVDWCIPYWDASTSISAPAGKCRKNSGSSSA